ncbi:MAG: chromosomal replication initiator protein DnaA [Actinomycetales bacterium]|nr:chromosomal replication initiator protein DnaA [Actinomycetales bacterium]
MSTPGHPATPTPDDGTLDDLWAVVLSQLDRVLTPQQRAFVALARPLARINDTVFIAAPNDFTRDVLQARLRPAIVSVLTDALGQEVTLAVSVDPSLAATLDEDATDTLADAFLYERLPRTDPTDSDSERAARPGSGAPATRRGDGPHLNPKYIFDTFVIGSSNRFAHAAAVAVAEQPARSYNPLFIYGGSGLGKTHLLHAIGLYTMKLYRGTKVRYVSSEEFTNDFINSIRDDKASLFQRSYRAVDVLLVDDIQFLSGKVQTQEEFFHTFNTLHNSDKQIVVTSDLPPKQLPEFEERMRSRFEWGLITDIQPPDLETRIAILRKKTAAERLNIPPEVLEYIAVRITHNIRELEGALIRISAFANVSQQPVDLGLAEIVLRDVIPDSTVPDITAPMIMSETAHYFGISLDELTGPSRSRTLVTARQVAMYLCRELTDLSLPRIGQIFGGRDHTTVMHAERKVRALMSERRGMYNQVADLTSRIRSQSRSS